jgi:hypothetical protein
MQNVADIFAAWPSDADLARDIGLSYPTVASWKQRGSIPVAYWRPIIQAAGKRRHPEITADLLLELHAREPKSDSVGFGEADSAYDAEGEVRAELSRGQAGPGGAGHFSRHKHVRRSRFRTAEEIEEHIQALREEWSHR